MSDPEPIPDSDNIFPIKKNRYNIRSVICSYMSDYEKMKAFNDRYCTAADKCMYVTLACVQHYN